MSNAAPSLRERIVKTLSQIASVLSSAENGERLVVLRCADSVQVETAVSTIQKAYPKVPWELVNGGDQPILQTVAQCVALIRGASPKVPILFALPGEQTGRAMEGAEAETFGRLVISKGLLAGPVVMVIQAGSVRVLADKAPEFWKKKKHYFAWPTEVPVFEEKPAVATPAEASRPAGDVSDGEIGSVLKQLQGERAADYLVEVARSHVKAGNVEKARSFLIRAAQIYGEAANLEGMAKTYGLLASVAIGRGDFRTGAEWLEQAEDNWRVLDDLKGLSDSLAQRGHVEFLRGKLDIAARCFREALDLDQELGDSERISAGFRRVAMVLEKVGKQRSAEDLLRKSLRLEQEAKRELGMARVLVHLARMALDQKNYVPAAEAIEQAQEICERVDAPPETRSAVLHQAGNLHLKRRRYDDASETYKTAIEWEMKGGDLLSLARTTAQLALTYAESGDAAAALFQYVKAHFFASKMRSGLATDLADQVAQIEPRFTPEGYNRILREATAEADKVVSRMEQEDSALPPQL